MKQRKLTPIQARALVRKMTGITNVVYEPTQTLAYTKVSDKFYRLVYDTNINFTGLAYRLY